MSNYSYQPENTEHTPLLSDRSEQLDCASMSRIPYTPSMHNKVDEAGPSRRHSSSNTSDSSWPDSTTSSPSPSLPSSPMETTQPILHPLLTQHTGTSTHSQTTNLSGSTLSSLPPSAPLPTTQRISSHAPRGIYHLDPNSETHWHPIISTIIGYTFQDADLLEEALESPGSGVLCVGRSGRQVEKGNVELANVGQSVMKLILRDQCYLLRLSSGEADRQISRFLSRTRLDNLARVSKIELFVRARKQVKITTRNAWKLIKEDVQGEDRTRTAARAIKAIVGAVYYDGGFLAARKVMEDLDLTIKMPGQVEGL